jgi:hypothetical protein
MPCYSTRMARRTCPSYVEGIRLYSEAKADFDGVIEQLKYDLNEGSDPKNSLHFGQVLNAAAYKRIAFTDFVPRRSSAICKEPGPGYRMSSRRSSGATQATGALLGGVIAATSQG